MSVPIHDPALLAQLLAADGVVELTDPAGKVIGTFAVDGVADLPPGIESPFTEAEMAERRKQRTGRPLAEIMAELREKYGE